MTPTPVASSLPGSTRQSMLYPPLAKKVDPRIKPRDDDRQLPKELNR